jgi:hypothetical protein
MTGSVLHSLEQPMLQSLPVLIHCTFIYSRTNLFECKINSPPPPTYNLIFPFNSVAQRAYTNDRKNTG